MQSHKRPHELSDILLKNLFEAEAFKHQRNVSPALISEPLYYSNSFRCQPVFFNAFKQLDNPVLEIAFLVKRKKKIFNPLTSQRESWSAAVHSILSGKVVNTSLRTVLKTLPTDVLPRSVEAYYTQKQTLINMRQ
ncbi:hypothetical protein [Endozoicomonas euniceicola]|uniref:Uncharacterized protein n=1 Tax=Endozoicomonas euniceicola TaxID=1234143 RepID=A0ABY6H2Q8_9GAMM|nr:hypothetical protein [Endozoicomonas euniceicola]UYM18409.1 hypothetical protein NX720_11040 [Endozoicomonas euniceicola]